MDRRDARASFLRFCGHYLVDVKFGIIMDVKATRAIIRQRLAQLRR
jgi:hypothetical protein